MTTVAQRYLTYSLSLRHLKSIRYAMNRRLLILSEKLRTASTPEKIERYRQGAVKLVALQNLIAEFIHKEYAAVRVTLSEQQSGIVLHAVKLTCEESKASLDPGGAMDLQDIEQLEGLMEVEKTLKDALPAYVLVQAGYDEGEIQAHSRTLFHSRLLL